MRRRPKLLMLAGLTGLALLAAAATGRLPATTPAAGPETIAPQRRDVARTVTATAELLPAREVEVGAQVSGQLSRLLVTEGDRVEAGQLLAEIDPRRAAAEVLRTEAALAALEAEIRIAAEQAAIAARQHERLARLGVRGVSAPAAIEDAASQRTIAEARLHVLEAQQRQAEAALETAQLNLQNTRILAPIAGTVTQIIARQGQVLNATNTAPLILRLADLSEMRLRAELSEGDVWRVSPGQPAWFTVIGAGERRWEGRLEAIQPEAVPNRDTVFFHGHFVVPNADGALRSRMTAQVFFLLEESRGALALPLAALRGAGRRGREDAVAVLQPDGRFAWQAVRLGARDEVHVAILEGIGPDARVAPRAERVR
ncbi:efflux RND transporter periplasmic adaptor subunit [Rubritepida flocculans]|uniref:efflux RND transporter periplasmic adaptor subunit n=1 Tax=Rubritepida flocculans TaxID=182403 RepID=UPI00041F93E2|nr:efflux RND transporter periplasmic adaptor subunit [Rubritepida flocculans]